MDEDAAEWRALSPTEAAGTAGDIYALLEYEKQGATGNLLGVHRGISPSFILMRCLHVPPNQPPCHRRRNKYNKRHHQKTFPTANVGRDSSH